VVRSHAAIERDEPHRRRLEGRHDRPTEVLRDGAGVELIPQPPGDLAHDAFGVDPEQEHGHTVTRR
jgi:hypothetical protein